MMPYRRRQHGKFIPTIAPEVRTAIVAAVTSGKTYVQVAEEFNVSIGTICKFVKANRKAVHGPQNVLACAPSSKQPPSHLATAGESHKQPAQDQFDRDLAEMIQATLSDGPGSLGNIEALGITSQNPFRQKYYHVDEFGYGYLDDK
jgi:hypothetical protein